MIKRKTIKPLLSLAISMLLSALVVPLSANDDASVAAQANNPLANMKAFNIHNYYIGELTGTDKTANQTWLRYAQNRGRVITITLFSYLIRFVCVIR